MFPANARTLWACWLVLPVMLGCVQSKIVIKVNRDGSGTIADRTLTKDALGNLLGPQFDPAALQQGKASMLAAEMGEGVTVASIKPIKAKGGWTGFETIYKFEDINQIAVNASMQPDTSLGPPGASDDAETAPGAAQKKPKMTFQFTAGDKPRLVIKVPFVLDGELPAENPPPEQMELARALLAGAKLEVSVQVEGTITETDADFVSSSKKSIGLMRLQVGDLLADEKAVAMLSQLDRSDQPAVRQALRSKPFNQYLQVQSKDAIAVSFE